MNSEKPDEEFPLVTVITPTYNSNPQYLKETIDSVLMQTYPKIEYIITDDGSKKFPEEDIRKYLSENARENVEWKIIRNLENVGIVRNMNGAIRASHGVYVFGCAHDDSYYDERVIEEWVKEFQRTGALVVTALMSIRSNGSNIPDKIYPLENRRNWLKNLTPKELHAKLLRECFICAPSTAYSRECIDKYNLYDEHYRIMEDYPTHLKLSSNNVKYHLWERIVIKYREGGVSNERYRNIYLEKDKLQMEIEICKSSKGVLKIIHTIYRHYLQYSIALAKRMTDENRYDYVDLVKHYPWIYVLTKVVTYLLKLSYRL